AALSVFSPVLLLFAGVVPLLTRSGSELPLIFITISKLAVSLAPVHPDRELHALFIGLPGAFFSLFRHLRECAHVQELSSTIRPGRAVPLRILPVSVCTRTLCPSVAADSALPSEETVKPAPR